MHLHPEEYPAIVKSHGITKVRLGYEMNEINLINSKNNKTPGLKFGECTTQESKIS